MFDDLRNKKVLIVGLMGERSIAYGIAKAMASVGVKLILSCLPRFTERVEKLTEDLGPLAVLSCDLSDDESVEQLKTRVVETVGQFDCLVHSVAFAPRDHLQGSMVEHTTRSGFSETMDISVYSLIKLTQVLLPCMNDNGSIIALSYLGAERAITNYNVMGVAKAGLESCVRYLARDCGKKGIRVNAISSGPIKTVSASGIKGLGEMLTRVADCSPIAKPVNSLQIGQVAVFLASDYSSAVTGIVLYADHGYHLTAN